MSVNNPLRVLFLLAVVALLALGVLTVPAWAQADGCQGGERVRSVNRWGNPATTFSPQPANTLEDLKSLITKYRSDIEVVLKRAGWRGNPADLFDTIANAKPGDGIVNSIAAPQGTEFDWMAFRKRSGPACVKDIVWVGRNPFDAWSIKVESEGYEYTFLMPKQCLNLGVQKGVTRKAVKPPTCDLKASFNADSDTITVTGSSDASDFTLTGVSGPGASLMAVTKAPNGTWTLKPTEDGSFKFSALAKGDNGMESVCEASVAVVRKKPVCVINATSDPATKMVSVSSAGSVGNVEMTGFALPGGSSGDLMAVTKSGDMWSYDAASTLPRRPGDYTYSFDAVASLNGYEAACSASAVLTREPFNARWILRGFGGPVSAKGDEYRLTEVVDGVEERTELHLGSGTLFGLSAEYLFSNRLGVEAAVMSGDLDSGWMFDRGELWLMAEDDVDFMPITVGLNYHVTPDKRADVFIGPFLGLVQYDDADFESQGETFVRDFDDDVGFGFQAGVDVPFGWDSPWLFTSALRYMATSAEEVGGRFDLAVDPVIITAGIGYRFK